MSSLVPAQDADATPASSPERRRVVVTGAAQGIGAAVAEAFSALGDHVALVDLDGDGAERLASAIRSRGQLATSFTCDVSDEVQVEETVRVINDQLGGIDVLVSNAGFTWPMMISKMTTESWRKVLAINLDGSFFWLRAVVPLMKSAGSGRVIFTVSSTAQNGSIGQAHYAAAKAGVLGLMRSAARELGRYNILINAVAPAAATQMSAVVREDSRFAGIRDAAALPRWASPQEVAGVYVFLAGSDSTYMTGQVVSADGGHLFVR